MATVYAQFPIHVGVKAGGVWNPQEITALRISKVLPASIGGYAEVDLPFLPIIETGIFWKRYQLDTSIPGFGSRTHAIEVPILVKKRFLPLPVQPFLAAGTTLRWVPSIRTNGLDVNLTADSGFGLTAAAGISIRALFIRIEPEFRVTRWLRGTYLPRNNQVEFLVGVRF